VDITVNNHVSGVIRSISPTSDKYPVDGWSDARNVYPAGTEIFRRPGSSGLNSSQPFTGKTFRSSVAVSIGVKDYLLQHWGDKLYLVQVDGVGNTVELGTVYDDRSQFIRYGEYIVLAIDEWGIAGTLTTHAHNYLIWWGSGIFEFRRMGIPEFLDSLLTDIALSQPGGVGNMEPGVYRYMFTMSIWDGSTMISEGGGFNEIANVKEISWTSAVGNKNTQLDFSGNLLSANMPDWVTHINIFRTINIDFLDYSKEDVYHDSEKSSPIYPYYRFVDKVAIGATPYTYVDSLSDVDLRKITDTYDTRGYKPVPVIHLGLGAPNGKLFFTDSTTEGNVYFTQGAPAPNKKITKHMESFAAGLGHWLEISTEMYSGVNGLEMSPLGDLMIQTISSTHTVREADPFRVNFLGETTGNLPVMVEEAHGCLNSNLNVVGRDGLLYVFGRKGYLPFDGSKFLDVNAGFRDWFSELNLAHLDSRFNISKMRGAFFPGSSKKMPDGSTGVDQILVAYPSVHGGTLDQVAAILFNNKPDNHEKVLTIYDGFDDIVSLDLSPYGREMLLTEATDELTYRYLNPGSERDKEGTANVKRIEAWFDTREFNFPDIIDYTVYADRVIVKVGNMDEELIIIPIFDDIINRRNVKTIIPNIDNQRLIANDARVSKTYEAQFDDEAYGNYLKFRFYYRSLKPYRIETLKYKFFQGERVV